MELLGTRLNQIDYLLAVPRFVVVALAFRAVAMSDVVGVVFLELVSIDVLLFGELCLPEGQGLLHRQADTLHEQAHLETTVVLQVMRLFKLLIERLHAGCKALTTVVVKVLKPDLVAVGWCLGFEDVEINGVVVSEGDQHRLNSEIFEDHRQDLVGLHQLLGEADSELRLGYRVKLTDRYVCCAFADVDLSSSNERERLFKWHFDEGVRLQVGISLVFEADSLLVFLPLGVIV